MAIRLGRFPPARPLNFHPGPTEPPCAPGASVTGAWTGQVAVPLELRDAVHSGDLAFLCPNNVRFSMEHYRSTESQGPR